jgi:hypothetical protein
MAKRSVARVTTPEKKVAEVKEVVVVEVPLQQSQNLEEEEAEEDEEEWEEELEAEEEDEKEVLDQDHMAIDDEEIVQTTALHQGNNILLSDYLCLIRFLKNQFCNLDPDLSSCCSGRRRSRATDKK